MSHNSQDSDSDDDNFSNQDSDSDDNNFSYQDFHGNEVNTKHSSPLSGDQATEPEQLYQQEEFQAFQHEPDLLLPSKTSTNHTDDQQAKILETNESIISFKTLQEWASSNNFAILTHKISANMERLVRLLTKNQLSVDWMYHLLIIFKKVVLAQVHQADSIMASVIDTNFLEFQLRHFLQQLQYHESLHRQIFGIMQDIFNVIEYVTKNLPQYTQKCYSCLCMIREEGKKMTILKDDSSLTPQFTSLMNQIEVNFPQCAQWNFAKRRRVKEIPRPDDEAPPQDFSDLTIFPDIEELEASFEPFLRANKISGAYQDVHHYTDVHFRLLREDYLSPIRNGLRDYKDAILQNETIKSQELRFYYGVQLVKMKSNDNEGITFMVKFDNSDLKDVIWEFSKRFMTGALLCFSKDNFKTVIFATVAFCNPEHHAEGCVKVTFESNLEDVFTTSEYDEYVMAETVSFFVSYRHVLEGLQEVRSLPLSRYLVKCKKNIHQPKYIDRNTCFDFSPIMKTVKNTKVNLLSFKDWPEPEETILNDSQLDGLKLALTKELAIIQGPPGTGKTYIGLKIMELLLRNKENIDSFDGPILVVCYTNHALDQFLEGILEFCKDGIVRVGGRSKSDTLQRFNLTTLMKNSKISQRIRQSIEKKIDFAKRRLRTICWRIRALWHQSLQLETNILTVEDLNEEISPAHRRSLADKTRSDYESNKVMSQWMKAWNADIERHINEAAKRHVTKMIIDEGAVLNDIGLCSKIGVVRPDFETRIQIYRWWLQKLKIDLQERKQIIFGKALPEEEQEKLLDEITEQLEESVKDILPDDDLLKYMSNPNIYECIKKCVESESGEVCQSSYVKSWLFSYLRNTDQILDAITRLSRYTKDLTTKSEEDHQESQCQPRRGWIVENSDDSESDADSDLGFNIRNNAEEDESTEEISEFKKLEADFKYSERKEILLLQKAKLLGIDLSEEELDSEANLTDNTMTYTKIFRLLHARDPFSEEDISPIDNVWSLSLPERYRLYKYWMLKRKRKLAHHIIDLTKQYSYYRKVKNEAMSEKQIAILRGAKVIGMTTTGAAKNRGVLKQVASQIIVVEEAAEILEAHIITTLNTNCKHLILIGDHQQLRPNPTVYKLAKDYDFEISLFERLVKNEFPMVLLEEQHRMRPAIANYMRLIYPELIDHETVFDYENVQGVASNIFYLHHEYDERNVLDSTSKENIHEAEFLRQLCKYFLQQGYFGDQITILAAYAGQVTILTEIMQTNDEYKDVKISTIDNYQGEENDIILLSLVRSNTVEEVGFLKIDNRVCVALSRARRGLFVIGNLNLLAKHSRLWSKIIEKATRTRVFGKSMKLKCVNHSDTYSFVSTAEDFLNKVPEGGCSLPCDAVLNCGHICPRLCHASDRDHQERECHQTCLETCTEGHPCQKECYQDCGQCEVLVEKKIAICEHIDLVRCFEDEYTACCHQPCRQQLECGHECKGFCGNCLKSGTHSPCEELVQRQWPCKHMNMIMCHSDIREHPCPEKCTFVLSCGHKCQGSCGGCLNGRVHKICFGRCEKILPCGHQCSGKCSVQCEPCPLLCPLICRHGPCSKTTCGEPCDLCMENCAMICKHQQCSERCADECTTKAPCKKKCPLTTKCKHACSSLCGEECVCFICEQENFKLLDFSKKKTGKTVPVASKERAIKFKLDKETVLMKIPRCKHIFTISQLDKYVKEYDPDGSYYICCPVCPNKIHNIIRYNEEARSRFLRRENRKRDLIESVHVSQSELDELQLSSEVSEPQTNQLNCNSLKALKYQHIFINVLKKCESMHEHFNWTHPLNLKKWRTLILTTGTRVTDTFIEELTMEFHRLLIMEQMAALAKMIDDAGHTLEKTLKRRCKVRKILREKLNAEVKREGESVLEELYQVSALKNDATLEQQMTCLREKSQDIKDVLDCDQLDASKEVQ